MPMIDFPQKSGTGSAFAIPVW